MGANTNEGISEGAGDEAAEGIDEEDAGGDVVMLSCIISGATAS